MPRGVAFSGKAKKKQLQAKRALKKGGGGGGGKYGGGGGGGGGEGEEDEELNSVLPQQLLTQSLGRSSHHNKWSTVFVKESKEVVEARRIASSAPVDISKRGVPLRPSPRSNLDPVLAHPRGVLLRQGRRGRAVYLADDAREIERAEFSLWLENIYARYETSQLNMFEHNMEVWMQLWHTLATADVVCIIADARNPLWHIPESLVDQVLNELKKPLVIVLNKTDLVPPDNVTAWIEYLQNLYPTSRIVPFSASGAELGDAMTLSLRRRLLRAARLSRDEAHTGRRVQSARSLLSAAGSPQSSIHVVERRLMALCRAGTRREDALLSVDASKAASSSVAMGAGEFEEEEDEEEEEEEDEEEEEGGEEEDDYDGDEVVEDVLINVHVEDTTDIASDQASAPGDIPAEFEEDRDKAEDEADDDDDEIVSTNVDKIDFIQVTRMHQYHGGKPLISRHLPQQKRNEEGSGPRNHNKDSNLSDDDEGVDRFAGRPRRYKRGDAGKKVEEMERGFKAGAKSKRGSRGGSRERDEGPNPKEMSKIKKSAKAPYPPSAEVKSGTRNFKSSARDSGQAASGDGRTFISSSEKALLAAEAAALSRVNDDGLGGQKHHRPLTIGMVGHPNVGKSSVINCLCGEKKVSVSRTAGHTKRAQTIHLVQRDEGGSTCDPVDLLDCPGLVFPHALVPQPPPGYLRATAAETSMPKLSEANALALTPAALAHPIVVTPGSRQARLQLEASTSASANSVPSTSSQEHSTSVDFLTGEFRNERAMQECCGVIPLAQVREAYSTVRFLSEHLPIERLYGLQMSKDDEEDWHGKWNPLGICESLATKRGYFTARTGRPDGHAAGREILYDAQDGIIPLFWLPPLQELQ